MSRTISGYYNTLQVLGTTIPSVIVTGTVKAGGSFSGTLPALAHGYAAIYGPKAGDFTITNSGLIDDTSTTFANANAGIVLGGVGSVNNTGTILALGGEGEGIYMYAGGTATNSGTIIGQQQGIFLGNQTGTNLDFVDNTGFVESTTKDFPFTENGNTYIGTGVGILAIAGGGGTIVNAAGATVEAQYGVGIELAAIHANFLTGVDTVVSGSVLNAGTIKAAYGVFFYALGTFTNSGKIFATEEGAQIRTKAVVINSGTITGDIGIYATSADTIHNSGSIGGTGTAAFTPIYSTATLQPTGILLTDGGTISNSASGVITSAAGYGIDLKIGGSVSNAGKITGKDASILSSGEAFVTNAGTIKATGTTFVTNGITGISSGILMGDGGELTNKAGGKIIAVELGIYGSSSSPIATTINNSGLIEVTGTKTASAGTLTFAPIAIDLLAGGTVSNSSTGTIIGGGAGIVLEAKSSSGATVNNSGLITAGTETFVSGLNTYSGTGIVMLDGGSVINNATGTISAEEAGIVFVLNTLSAPGTLKNSGLIEGLGGPFYNDGSMARPLGVLFNDGGTLTNEATGIILGFSGVYLLGGTANISAYLDNFGSIDGTGEFGVLLGQSASLTNSGHITGNMDGAVLEGTSINNLAGGTISGVNGGILAYNMPGIDPTINNAGDIIATGSSFVLNGATDYTSGVAFTQGGTLDNKASGNISGYNGVTADADTTLINAGTITGRGGPAVYFYGLNDKVIDDPGAVFNGVVDDNVGNGNLELAAGATTGTIASFGSEFLGFPTVSVDAGATWDIGGTITNLLNNGLVNIVSGASLDISSAVNPASTGTFELTNKGSLEIASLLGTNVKIKFLGATPANKLTIDSAANFGQHVGTSSYKGPLLEDFAAGDVIDLKGISSTGLKLSYSTTTGDLQITASGGGVVATLEFQNSSLGAGSFHTATDNAGGTLLTHS
jgi:hypothetical protein